MSEENPGQIWERTCEAQAALQNTSPNDLRRAIKVAYADAQPEVKWVALGIVGGTEMTNNSTFYTALGRCKDVETLEEVLEWLISNK